MKSDEKLRKTLEFQLTFILKSAMDSFIKDFRL
ncbi:hypothetical protein SAMN05428975_0284 [Mucilaginibacter sp. OK268]|nr:hypothetical protein SAMN05428975_0284 [Mucilaginibacter sp. OK268]